MMIHRSPRRNISWILSVGALLGIGAATVVLLAQEPNAPSTPLVKAAASNAAPTARPPDPARSVEAFRKVATVLRHPRCMNCHTATNFPRVGDDRKRHDIGVQRGPDDHGVAAMQCSTCHQDINQENGVPGAPGWALAPLKMAWEELDDRQLADQLKDPARNGPRSLEELYQHMATAELVRWAWKPGGGRTLPPLSHEEFARLVREWIDTGAVSPEAK